MQLGGQPYCATANHRKRRGAVWCGSPAGPRRTLLIAGRVSWVLCQGNTVVLLALGSASFMSRDGMAQQQLGGAGNLGGQVRLAGEGLDRAEPKTSEAQQVERRSALPVAPMEEDERRAGSRKPLDVPSGLDVEQLPSGSCSAQMPN